MSPFVSIIASSCLMSRNFHAIGQNRFPVLISVRFSSHRIICAHACARLTLGEAGREALPPDAREWAASSYCYKYRSERTAEDVCSRRTLCLSQLRATCTLQLLRDKWQLVLFFLFAFIVSCFFFQIVHRTSASTEHQTLVCLQIFSINLLSFILYCPIPKL